jgi:coiled-coil domain-containing protein 55
MSFKFGLGSQKKTVLPARKPAQAKATSAFGPDDSDDDAFQKIGAPDAKSKKSNKPKLPVSQYGDLSAHRSHKKNTEKALEVDPSIYDYDAAYDAMQAKAEARKAAEREKAEEGKAKYMENLLAAAEVRKRDQLRAREKVVQRERDAEGEEFADKEKFVTGAYKKQQEELRKLEEEEKRKEEAEEERKKKMGSQVFFRNLINQQDERYQDAVAATEASQNAGPPKIESKEKEKTDHDIAKELNAKGANIALTDDGDIADKRQLLSAGLNVIAKPKAAISKQSSDRRTLGTIQTPQNKASNQQATRERQSRMIEEQMEQLLKRQADDEADTERQREHAAKTQKTNRDLSSARERYLARKKAAAANTGNS